MEETIKPGVEVPVSPLIDINKAINVVDDTAAPVTESIDGESVKSALANNLLQVEDASTGIESWKESQNSEMIASSDSEKEAVSTFGDDNKVESPIVSHEDSTFEDDNTLEAPVVSHEAAAVGTKDHTTANWAGGSCVIDEGAINMPDVHLPCPSDGALTSPAAMSELLIATSDTSSEKCSDALALKVYVKEPEHVETDYCEKSEEDGPATITAVVEDAVQVVPLDEDMEDVLAKLRCKLACESVQMLESGEILALPTGWTTRQSKTNDGKMYFVSPYGHTQWIRPPLKTGVMYKWVHEIEVTFGPGRLGLNLKQIAGIPGTEFTDLQVHVAEIYKLPNGMASPAEIYNWSVKPEKRLAANMRVTAMSGISLTGFTYSEVLELLARVVRPVQIKFADVSKGIVGRVNEAIPDEETEEGKETRAARLMQSSLRSEYFQILISFELHKQVWAAARHHMQLKTLEMQKKNEVMELQVESEQQHQEFLEKELEYMVHETASLKQIIEQLDKQLAGEIESLEVLRTAELVQRTAVLEKEVTEIIGENNELQSIRAKIEETLDTLQQELDAYGDLDVDYNSQHEVKFFSPAFLGTIVHRGSIDTRAEDARERLLEKIIAQRNHLKEEIKLEEERAQFIESEINQFRDQISVAAEAVKREDAFISGKRPPQMIFLENKIALLKKNLRETMAGIAKAAQSGDHQQADNLFIRRADLKDDLNAALDEMRRMESESNVLYDVDQGKQVQLPHSDPSLDIVDIDEAPHDRVSESSRLQSKLAKLQVHLHETVALLAKAASEDDEARKSNLANRRLMLKNEMKAVQDQFEALTQGTLNVVVKSRDSDPKLSLASPMIQNVPRKATGGSRASLSGGLRGLVGSARVSMASDRSSYVARISECAPRDSDRSGPNFGRRSGSSASRASLDSNSNQGPRNSAMPMMSGILRKHATHSNEKGAFGNMSIRGVRERWFNIESDGYLRYYKREGDREPRGAISLSNKSLEILHGKEVGKPNEFILCSPTHQTRMLAKTHAEMLVWVKVLEQAHAFFMQQSCGSNENGQDQESKTVSPDVELAYRNKRATLGF